MTSAILYCGRLAIFTRVNVPIAGIYFNTTGFSYLLESKLQRFVVCPHDVLIFTHRLHNTELQTFTTSILARSVLNDSSYRQIQPLRPRLHWIAFCLKCSRASIQTEEGKEPKWRAVVNQSNNPGVVN